MCRSVQRGGGHPWNRCAILLAASAGYAGCRGSDGAARPPVGAGPAAAPVTETVPAAAAAVSPELYGAGLFSTGGARLYSSRSPRTSAACC